MIIDRTVVDDLSVGKPYFINGVPRVYSRTINWLDLAAHRQEITSHDQSDELKWTDAVARFIFTLATGKRWSNWREGTTWGSKPPKDG